MERKDLEEVSNNLYSLYLESKKSVTIHLSDNLHSLYLEPVKSFNKDLIKRVHEQIIFVHDHISKYRYSGEEQVIIDDSVTSLQIKLFNGFIRDLARGNFKECEYKFWDYMQQVFWKKKLVTKAEILQIYSMCEGLIYTEPDII